MAELIVEPKAKPVCVTPREIMVNIVALNAQLPFPGVSQMSPDYVISQWIKAMDQNIGSQPDLIVLPEICDLYGGIPDRKVQRQWLECRGDTILKAFQEYARNHHAYLVYPTYRHRKDGKLANCSILIDREGDVIACYDKVYPTLGDIDGDVIPGNGPVCAQTDFGKLTFAICFDLNFWDLLEKTAQLNPDVIAFSSFYHGAIMQQTWAYRCQAHFIGSTLNRLPKDILGPAGDSLYREDSYFTKLIGTINTNCKLVHLDGNWQKLEKALNTYGRDLQMRNHNHLGAVTLTSMKPEVPIQSILDEFQMETWNQYYQRSKDRADQTRIPATGNQLP